MTKRQRAAELRRMFEDAPYRVVYASGVRSTQTAAEALAIAEMIEGVAWKGTSRDMAAGTAERIS